MPHSILSPSQIAEALSDLPDWSYDAPRIEAKYAFADFRDAIAFIVQVAFQAEILNHHPTLQNTFNKVSFSLNTQDVGDKVTELDIELAKHISETAARFLSLEPKA